MEKKVLLHPSGYSGDQRNETRHAGFLDWPRANHQVWTQGQPTFLLVVKQWKPQLSHTRN